MYKSKQKDVFRSKYIFLPINEHGRQQNVGAAASYGKETPVEAPGHPSNSAGDLGKSLRVYMLHASFSFTCSVGIIIACASSVSFKN